MDPDTSTVQSVIALQYNPDSLTHTLQVQAVPGGQDGVRVDALRLRGSAIETTEPPTGWKPVGSMFRRLQARLNGSCYSPSTRKSPSAFVMS
jgi:hypothetical protein